MLTHNSLHRECENMWITNDEVGEKFTIKSTYIKLHNTFNGIMICSSYYVI